MTKMTCPKCGGEMRELRSMSDAHASGSGVPIASGSWVTPASGTIVTTPGSASSSSNVTYLVCRECGYGYKVQKM